MQPPAGALNCFQDIPAVGAPGVAARVFIAPGQINNDRIGQFPDAAETALADGVLGKIVKEALDEIQP